MLTTVGAEMRCERRAESAVTRSAASPSPKRPRRAPSAAVLGTRRARGREANDDLGDLNPKRNGGPKEKGGGAPEKRAGAAPKRRPRPPQPKPEANTTGGPRERAGLGRRSAQPGPPRPGKRTREPPSQAHQVPQRFRLRRVPAATAASTALAGVVRVPRGAATGDHPSTEQPARGVREGVRDAEPPARAESGKA